MSYDDHSNVIVNDHGCDNGCDIHVIHDTVRDNHDLIFKDNEDHNDVIVKCHDNNSNYDIHVNNNTHIKNNDDKIYDNNDMTYNDQYKYSTRLDNNDVLTYIYWFATDCDGYNDYNNNINMITCDYGNYDEDNSNHVDCYDVSIVHNDDIVEIDCEENNYSTSLVPCVLSRSGTTSTFYVSDPIIPRVAFLKKEFRLLSVRRWSNNTTVV